MISSPLAVDAFFSTREQTRRYEKRRYACPGYHGSRHDCCSIKGGDRKMKGDGVWEMMCARVIVDRGVGVRFGIFIIITIYLSTHST